MKDKLLLMLCSDDLNSIKQVFDLLDALDDLPLILSLLDGCSWKGEWTFKDKNANR